MQETPSSSPSEISWSLLRYPDGAPETDSHSEAETPESFASDASESLLDGFWKRLSGGASLPETLTGEAGETNPLWSSIASALESDRQAAPLVTDVEWLCAYYDRELPSDDPLLCGFENQLSQNPQASQALGEIAEISEAIRLFALRLENSCAISLTEPVMAALSLKDVRLEEGTSENILPVDEELPLLVETGISHSEAELLSAYVDQALSPRQMIDATRLTENNEAARITLLQFNRLSGEIQSFFRGQQEEAPDLWPQIFPILSQELAEKTAQAARASRGPRLNLRFIVPVAAAAAVTLIWFVLPNAPWTPRERSAGELASVPISAQRSVETDFNQTAAPTNEDTRLAVLHRNEAAPAELSSARRETPSSEEYLFSALKEHAVAQEDVAVIFGK